jgi:hypothetical protein
VPVPMQPTVVAPTVPQLPPLPTLLSPQDMVTLLGLPEHQLLLLPLGVLQALVPLGERLHAEAQAHDVITTARYINELRSGISSTTEGALSHNSRRELTSLPLISVLYMRLMGT